MNDGIPILHRQRVEIHGGVLTASTITDYTGTRQDMTYVGKWRFFVDVIEEDGTVISMWDGASYDAAIIQAVILSEDFGPVYDRVVDVSP